MGLFENRKCDLCLAFLILFFFVVSVPAQIPPLHPTDAQVLAYMIDAIPALQDSPYNWDRNLVNESCLRVWMGISCNTTTPLKDMNYIISMQIELPNATGYLPSPIHDLAYLEDLEVLLNFSEPTPITIKDIPTLRTLRLRRPRIGIEVDVFPTWFSQMPQLTQLELQNFNFSAETSLDSVLNAMISLQVLGLSFCDLRIPFPILPNVTNMQQLWMHDNRLTGAIPQWVSDLDGLKSFLIQNNEMEGNVSALVPSEFLTACNVSNNTPAMICPPQFSICCQGFNGSVSSTTSTTVSTATTNPPAISTTFTSTTTTTTTMATITTSTTTSCTGYGCKCSSDLGSISPTSVCQDGKWTINGAVTNNQTVTVSQGDTVIINGTLVNQGTLQVYANSSGGGNVVVGETAELAGTLVIVVTSALNGSVNVALIKASSISGKFDKVEVQQQYPGSKCYRTTAETQYTPTSLSVLMSQKATCDTSKSKVIGIAVGVCLGVIILVAIMLIVVVIVYKKLKGPDAIRMSNSALA